MMIGTDFDAVCSVIEKRTGIPTLPVKTNGMNTYVKGASMAFLELAKRFVTKKDKTQKLSCNILGVTPLDFSVNTSVQSMKNALTERGVEIVSCWAMGDSLENIKNSSAANVNLVVSLCGIEAAEYMKNKFGIPYVVARPTAAAFTDKIAADMRLSAQDGINRITCAGESSNENARVIIIGEGVSSNSLAAALKLEAGIDCCVICATDDMGVSLGKRSVTARDEDELMGLINDASVIVADPLYKPVCPKGAGFVPLPHEAFSGRIFRKDIPDTAKDIESVIAQIERIL